MGPVTHQRPGSRSSSSRRGASAPESRRGSAASTSSEEERRVVRAAPPSPRCVKRKDFKAVGRARSRAKNLRRMSGGGSSLGVSLCVGQERGSGTEGPGAVMGGEEVGQELCPGVGGGGRDNIADKRVEVVSPPLIMLDAYTVGEEGPGPGVGSDEDLSDTGPAPPCLVTGSSCVTSDQREETIVLRKNERNEFLSSVSVCGLGSEEDCTDTDCQEEPGSGFWTHRSSVISITDSARGSSVPETGSPTESVREFLMQKRSSLTHTPDIIRVLQKVQDQHVVGDVHEFQKVKSELKHVDDETATYLQLERISQISSFSNFSESSSDSVTIQQKEDTLLEDMEKTSTKNVIVDLIPEPLETFNGTSKKDNSTNKLTRKKKTNKIGEPKQVPVISMKTKKDKSTANSAVTKPKYKPPDNTVSKRSKSDQKETLLSPNLIQQLKPSQNGADKPATLLRNGSLVSPSLLREVNRSSRRSVEHPSVRPVMKKSHSSSPPPLSSRRHVSKPVIPPTPLSQQERSKSPDKILASQLDPLDNASSEPHKARKQSSASMTSLKSTSSDQPERKSSFKATEPISKGGFLAPTKSWLSLRGDNVSLKSRSPSPGSKSSSTLPRASKERSVSPRRRLRESSTDSDAQSRKSVTFEAKERKPSEKDPSLPAARRRPTPRSESGGATNGRRMSSSKKQSRENIQLTNGVNGTEKTKRETLLKRRDSSKENVATGRKSISNGGKKPGEQIIKEKDVPVVKKTPPPVPVKSSAAITCTKNKTQDERKMMVVESVADSQLEVTIGGTVTSAISTSTAGWTTSVAAERSRKSKTSLDRSEEKRVNSASRKYERSESLASLSQMKMVRKESSSAEISQSSSRVKNTSEKKTHERSLNTSENHSERTRVSTASVSKEEVNCQKEVESSEAVSTRKASSRVRNTNNVTTSSIIHKSSSSSSNSSSSAVTKLESSSPTPVSEGLLRTTMVVRFRPGQPSQQRTWEVTDSPSSICGLEISFSSIPQDIDIKVIPSTGQQIQESSASPENGGEQELDKTRQ